MKIFNQKTKINEQSSMLIMTVYQVALKCRTNQILLKLNNVNITSGHSYPSLENRIVLSTGRPLVARGIAKPM